MKSRLIKRCLLGVVLAAGVLTAGYTAGFAFAEEQPRDQILDNVYIEELDVGGMDAHQAELAVEEYVEKLQAQTTFTLQADKKNIKVKADQLGLSWDNTQVVEEAMEIGKSGSLIARYKDKKDLEHEPKVLDLHFTADEAKVAAYLKNNVNKLDQAAKDCKLKRKNGSFEIIDGKNGVAVDVEKSVAAIEDFISEKWDGESADIELAADIVQPRGTKEELSKVQDLLGEFTTDYSASSYGRAQNVVNGCSKINGTILYPGDQFSVYETVSPFDAEHGYALAGTYENGRVVDTYGGGICQVSSTLYNAVIRAELEIKERSPHSMLVSYVEPSMDAAIAGTVKDMKFVNSTEAPVYIEGSAEGGILTFKVYGEETRPANRQVSFESEVTGESQPRTQIQGSSAYPVGYVGVTQSAHVGKSARLWKVVKVDGKEVSREEFNTSTYYSSPKIVVVGTATSNPKASAAIQQAISSQSEGNIYTAAANAAAIAAQPAEPEEPEESKEEEAKEESKEEAEKKPEVTEKKDTAQTEKKPEVTEKKDTAQTEKKPASEQKQGKAEEE